MTTSQPRLIYAVNVRLPGDWAHSVQIMKTCEAFSARGIKVELITGLKRGVDDKIFSYYDIKNKFKIVKIPCLNLSQTSPSKFNFLLRSFSYLLFAKLYVMRREYDILYFRTHLAGLFFSNFYLEVHDLPPRLKWLHRRAFKKARKIIVLTSYLKKKLVESGVAETKIIVAADGVDLEKFKIKLSRQAARERLGLPADKKIIVYCGNLDFHDWKGVDILIKSLAYLDNVLCFLVGSDEAGSVRYQKSDLIITGRKAHAEVPFYLGAADALILPNKKGDANSEYYTSPLKLFEYMAAGRPIVASNLPSIREVLNQHNAVLVEPNSPEELARGIKKVLENKTLAEKLAEQALIDVENFSWQKRAEKIAQ